MHEPIERTLLLLTSTEGLNEQEVNDSMVLNDCRKVSKFELLLIDSAIVYLSTKLNLSKEIFLIKKHPQFILFRRLMIKLLLQLTNLDERQLCILLDLESNGIQTIKNTNLPALQHDRDFMEMYSSLVNHIISNAQLTEGNSETNHNMILTRRIRELVNKVNS